MIIKKYLLMILAICSFITGTNNVLGFDPKQEVSGINNCQFDVTGFKSNGLPLNFTSTDCDFSYNFPDGAFNIHYKSPDNTPNLLEGDVTVKVDTTAPICTLNRIDLSGNMYYSGGKLFYKQHSSANGRIDLNVTCVDPGNINYISGLAQMRSTSILGEPGRADTLAGGNTKTSIYSYNWNGYQTSSIDLLNTAFFTSTDNSGNIGELIADTNTEVYYNGNLLKKGITSLVLSPDSQGPLVEGSLYNANDFIKYASGNNNGVLKNIGNTSPYLAALNNRQIQIPGISDTISGVPNIKIIVDQYNGTKKSENFSSGVKTFNNNFQTAGTGTLSDMGVKDYEWDVITESLDGNKTNQLCDYVGNCITISTPDFKVVSNVPYEKVGNDIVITGNDAIANLSSAVLVSVDLVDVYGNNIVPVNGVKNIELTSNFTNTLGVNQLIAFGPEKGDGVDFDFTPKIVGINNKDFTRTFTTLSSDYGFNGKMEIVIKSAVPTKNQHKTINNTLLYGSNSAELKLNKLNLNVSGVGGNLGIGENTGLDYANPTGDNFLFKTPIKFSITDLDPIVEGQIKKLTITNELEIGSGLNNYRLNTHIGSSNEHLKIKNLNINLGASNDSGVIDITQSSIATNDNGSIYFIPKTTGGINDNDKTIGLYSNIHYNVGGINVSLPGNKVGLNVAGPVDDTIFDDPTKFTTEFIFSEIDVMGLTQTNNDSDNDVTADGGTNFDDISNISLLDIKTNIEKNVSTFLRGHDKEEGRIVLSNKKINISNWSSISKGLKITDDILYFYEADVIIDCSGLCGIGGKKTIIVEKGSLRIDSNMYYENDDSILGIILIGNESSDNWENSKLKINKNITNGVGVVYSDGPVVSIDDNTSGTIYDGSNTGEGDLKNQLLWEGSFITRNTVGGSIKTLDGNNCPYGTEEYKNLSTCTLEKAQAYDLIYLRRYARKEVGSITVMLDTKIPLNLPVKIAGGIEVTATNMDTGDTNLTKSPSSYDSPFILKYDSQVQTNPPHLFEK